MSAVIQNEYTGNGSTTTYSFTFPYLKTSDIKASLDGVDTTAFTLPNATTLQFNTAPTNGAKIKIFRQTSVDNLTATFYAGSAIKSEDLNDNFTQNLYKTQEIGGRFISNLGGTMTGDLNMGEDTVIKFEGATDDAHETTLTVADPTADRTITLPNVTGTVVTTGDTGTVATGMIAADAVTGAKIADDQINSEHYVDGSIDTAHIADAQVTTAKIADSNVTTGKLAADAVTAAKLADNAVVTANIVNNAVTNDKLATDSVSGDNIINGTIQTADLATGLITTGKLADNSVTQAKMADDSVGTAELVDSSVDTARLADNSVTLAKMADNSVGTSEIVDAAVTTAKLANTAVTTAKIADAQITSGKLGTGAVINAKLDNNSVSTSKIQDASVTNAKLATGAVTTVKLDNDAVTTAKIASNAVTSAEIADDAVGSTELGDGVIDTVHVGAAQITTAKIADSNITTAKITDANVTTAKIANDAITIGKLGCEQTTISDSDSHIPTSGAVVDYVAAQIAPLGGLEVIANEDSFPTTQPSAGVVISINDIEGLITNGSGVATNARTTGNGSDNVTINGFPSSLYSKTMAAGLGLMVSSTGSSQTYTYHKLLAKEADVEQLSNDINDFASRYRVGSTNPTSSLDNGDLFFNTSTGKMLVYNGTNTAWEEVQSIGNFFISTFSEAFDGSRTQFTLSNAPTNVQQVLLSLNGVVQKPGTAFTLSGSTVTLASAPASGTDYFAVVMGSTVNIGTPSNDTVSTAVLQDDSVTTAKIAASNVTATELGANAVITSKIADDAVTNAKLADNAVGTAQIANSAITSAKFASSSVDSNALGSQVVVTANIADDAVTAAKLASGVQTTINSNADNRLITGSGTANTLNAESGITFSGTELKIGGDTGVAGTWGLEIYQSDTANNKGTALIAGNAGAELQLRDTVSGETIKIAANGQASFYSQKENDPMVFFTKPTSGSDTERFRISGDGKIYVGGNGASATAGELWFNDTSTYSSKIAQVAGSSALTFHTGSSQPERIRIDSSGRLLLGTTTEGESGADDLTISNTSADMGMTLRSGTSNKGQIFFSDATSGSGEYAGFIQYAHNTNSMRFGTNELERMRIDSSGRLGIGDTSPTKTLTVGTTTPSILLDDQSGRLVELIGGSTSTGPELRTAYAEDLRFGTNSTERMRITSAGKVGIGTTSPSCTGLNVAVNSTTTSRPSENTLQINNSNNGASTCAGIVLACSTGSNTEFNIVTQKHSSGTGADFFLDNGTKQRMEMSGDNGDIKFGVDGTMIGTFTPGYGNTTTGIGLEPRNGSIFASRSGGPILFLNTNTDGGYLATFRRSGNEQGKIIAHSQSVSYETSSDYRLKENAVGISDGITRLKQLKPYRFNFKNNSSEILDGFFAHEAQTVVPECASGTKDEVVVQAQVDSKVYKESELGNPIYQGIDQSKLVPLLTAALQEEISKREALETRVATLEAA